MTTTPDRLARRGTSDGAQRIVFHRTFAAPLADVWAACTEPARMQRWIGTWSGDPASGEIAFRMTAEGEDVPEEVYVVEACEPPHRFTVHSREAAPFSEDASGPRVVWRLTLELSEQEGVTTLVFSQDAPDGPLGAEVAASVGPGWDYYLDRLAVALRGGDPGEVAFAPYLERSEHSRALFT